jgi:hypothetical protein
MIVVNAFLALPCIGWHAAVGVLAFVVPIVLHAFPLSVRVFVMDDVVVAALGLLLLQAVLPFLLIQSCVVGVLIGAADVDS